MLFFQETLNYKKLLIMVKKNINDARIPSKVLKMSINLSFVDFYVDIESLRSLSIKLTIISR